MMMALGTGLLIGGPTAAVVAGYADKKAADDARDQLRKDAALDETARNAEKAKAKSQLITGTAASGVDPGSKSVLRQEERIGEVSDIEQYAADARKRYELTRLKRGGKNAVTQGWISGASQLGSNIFQTAWMART